MEFTNEFRVPADVDTVFSTLVDLERVAPCMPGATLEEVDGATYTGRMKVKVGPAQMTYRGTAEVTEVDDQAKRAAITANGKEARGGGTAAAEVTATLREEAGETVVTVDTQLKVTGKPAQFGRGVMEEVGTKIIGQFADRLQAMLLAGDEEPTAPGAPEGGASAAAAPSTPASDAPATSAPDRQGPNGQSAPAKPTTTPQPDPASAPGPRRIAEDPSRADDALDLMEVAGSATIKRLAPVAVGLAVVVALLWWWRRR